MNAVLKVLGDLTGQVGFAGKSQIITSRCPSQGTKRDVGRA